MRVFVFFVMMMVSFGGMLGGYRAITGKDLVSLSDFGVGQRTVSAASQPTVERPMPTPQPTAIPQPTLAVQPPAAPVPSPQPETPKVMAVSNTGGQGVYLRRTPRLTDRVRAWMEGTRVEVSGEPTDGDGVQWLKVKTPDGVEGFIPGQFLAPVS